VYRKTDDKRLGASLKLNNPNNVKISKK